jgi:phospholipid/cholesterol/gamma-HCH transport system ATP-binding protein
VTSVVISHDMASTFRIAHKISMLYDGKIAVSGTPDDIKRSRLPFVREFVEMSGTVRFLGEASDFEEADQDDDDATTGEL